MKRTVLIFTISAGLAGQDNGLPKPDFRALIIDLMGADGKPCKLFVSKPFGSHTNGLVSYTSCPYKEVGGK